MENEKTSPLHLKVQQALLASFNDMAYFSPLSGERELCQQFNVSRPTIRKALENLEREKIITKIQGRGSFYIGNKVPIDYSNTSGHGLGLFQVLSSAGKFTKSYVLQQDIEFPHTDIAASLNLKKEEMVFHLKRLRYVNNELYSLADDYIPLNICPHLLETDFANASLFKTLEENNVIPYKEDKTIEVKRSDMQEATHLNLKKGDPLSVTRILTYDKDSNIIQYATSKADAYKSRFRIISSIQNERMFENAQRNEKKRQADI
ncbi:GntR family transcriptional regulator [Pectinatus haikarae]|uniref:GntR family transcriptional regulator n=1 Tax=Pectinatus haikarae TaxID=349096 RepID=A0ABT9Y5V8_9FIRM|nr:GntR family transcriptional regulator [Pectinatus haikarae]MDQ0203209.1 GntR family transcriptional regulator [Pectinatus haikarae]